jgi:hypothetical protein
MEIHHDFGFFSSHAAAYYFGMDRKHQEILFSYNKRTSIKSWSFLFAPHSFSSLGCAAHEGVWLNRNL